MESDSLIIRRLPMPPSSNHLYPTNKAGRRYKDKSHPFWKEMRMFQVKHSDEISRLAALMDPDIPLRVDRYFFFFYESLYTKAGKPRVMDISNKLKAFDDELAKIMSVDDSRIFYGTEAKVVISSEEHEKEWATVRITTKNPLQITSLPLELQSTVPGIWLQGLNAERDLY